MVAQVAACYLYPVKGLTPLAVPTVELRPGESAVGDRVFVFAFADAERREADGWVSKKAALTLVTTPGLATVQSAYDPEARRITLAHPKHGSVSGAVDLPSERVRLCDWLAAVVLELPKNPLHDHPERLPLQLLGDGTSRFTDRGPQQISLAGEASALDLAQRVGTRVDLRRFRLNFVLRGLEAWEELGWAGRRLRIGTVTVTVTAPLVRCKAIEASPDGGDRDLTLLDTLEATFGHLHFGVEARVESAGRIHRGDAVSVLTASASG